MPATDNFFNMSGGLTAPFNNGFAITPNDGADIASVTRGIYVGGDGHLTVVMQGGNEITLSNVKAGMVYAVRATRVKMTGTTATNLVGLE